MEGHGMCLQTWSLSRHVDVKRNHILFSSWIPHADHQFTQAVNMAWIGNTRDVCACIFVLPGALTKMTVFQDKYRYKQTYVMLVLFITDCDTIKCILYLQWISFRWISVMSYKVSYPPLLYIMYIHDRSLVDCCATGCTNKVWTRTKGENGMSGCMCTRCRTFGLGVFVSAYFTLSREPVPFLLLYRSSRYSAHISPFSYTQMFTNRSPTLPLRLKR